MASVFDVAKYILHKRGRMSTWKLQKLCYYSQAWQLAWTDHELFPEDFEAWRNGPVCRALFYEHHGKFSVEENDIPHGNVDALTDDERETVDIVLEGYGDREPYELREQTHFEPPWKNARNGLPEEAPCETVITKDSMIGYYGSL